MRRLQTMGIVVLLLVSIGLEPREAEESSVAAPDQGNSVGQVFSISGDTIEITGNNISRLRKGSKVVIVGSGGNWVATVKATFHTKAVCTSSQASRIAKGDKVYLATVTEPRESGLVAWYKLHGDANDSSGNKYHGFFPSAETTPAPAKNRKGVEGHALQFDGLDNASGGDYVEINNSQALAAIRSTSAVSVTLWAYMDDWALCKMGGNGRPQDRSLVSMAEGGGWQVYCNAEDNLVFEIYIGGSYRSPQTSIANLKPGWRFIGASYESKTGEAILTVDGAALAKVGGSKLPVSYPNTTLLIGADAEEGGGPEQRLEGNTHFKGLISDVKIYNRALTAAEMQKHFQKTR